MNEIQATLCSAFERLDQSQQMDVLQKEGVYIGKIKTEDGTVLLYQYQTIYIEIAYRVHRTLITEIHCFTDTAILDRYFTSVDFEKPEPGL